MSKLTFYSTVPDRRLKSLVKNGRDYSKPTLNEIMEEARRSNNTKKPQPWTRIVSSMYPSRSNGDTDLNWKIHYTSEKNFLGIFLVGKRKIANFAHCEDLFV